MTQTTIMLVDNHEIVRLGVRPLIEKEDDMQIAAEATTRTQAVDAGKS